MAQTIWAFRFASHVGSTVAKSSAEFLRRRVAVCGVATLMAVALTSVEAATVTGPASLYANPFAGSTATAGGAGVTGSNLSRVTNFGTGNSARISSVSGVSTGYMNFSLGAGNDVTIGTVIAIQTTGTGFNAPMATDIKLGATTVLSTPGTLINHVPQTFVATMPKGGVTANSLTVDFPVMPTYLATTTTYGDMNTVLCLPDRLEPIIIDTAGVSASHSLDFGTLSSVADKLANDGWNLNGPGAWLFGGKTDRFIEIDLGTVGDNDTYAVGVLLLHTRYDYFQDFEILYSTDSTSFGSIGTGVHVSMASIGGVNEMAVLKFDSPLMASHLRFVFPDTMPNNASNYAHLLDVIAFTVLPIPEPSSLALVGLTSLGLLRRRRR